MDSSVPRLWAAYLASEGLPQSTPLPPFWHFCDNEQDADTCAALVLAGRKRATAPTRWWFESRGEELPAVGDLDIVTDWRGRARCVIRTTGVEIVPFRDVTASFARIEGEGDGSLDFWREAHWAYYERELRGTGRARSQDMPVICQTFDLAFPRRPGQ